MFSILSATSSDAKAIADLVNSAYRGDSSRAGWTTEADLLEGSRTDAHLIAELMRQPNAMILKCVQNDAIIGCVELNRVDEGLYLGMLTVKPDLQGQGIGKALIKAAEEKAHELKLSKIVMTVISVRKELIDWYKRHGYTDTGKKKPFHFDDSRFGIPRQQLEFTVLEKKV